MIFFHRICRDIDQYRKEETHCKNGKWWRTMISQFMIPSWACARWHIVIVPSNTSEYTLALTTNWEYIIVLPWLTNSLSFSGRERVGPGPVAIMSPVPFSRVLFRSRSISFSRSSVFLVYIIRTRIHYALSHILPGPLYWLRPRVTQPFPPPLLSPIDPSLSWLLQTHEIEQ